MSAPVGKGGGEVRVERRHGRKVLDTFLAAGGKIAIFRVRIFYLSSVDLVDIGMPIAIILD